MSCIMRAASVCQEVSADLWRCLEAAELQEPPSVSGAGCDRMQTHRKARVVLVLDKGVCVKKNIILELR